MRRSETAATAVTSAEWGEGLKKDMSPKWLKGSRLARAQGWQGLKAGKHNPLGITVIRIDSPRNLAGTGKQYPSFATDGTLLQHEFFWLK